jgi:hypothetical protein
MKFLSMLYHKIPVYVYFEKFRLIFQYVILSQTNLKLYLYVVCLGTIQVRISGKISFKHSLTYIH